jgi:hypothetical protein
MAAAARALAAEAKEREGEAREEARVRAGGEVGWKEAVDSVGQCRALE